jgi:hypothetical protein
MSSVFPDIRPDSYSPHALHSMERMWPETNCYIDLWIEVLKTLGLPPEAMLGFTLGQDFEGDQFTFFKVPLEDLEALYGIRVTELAIFDKVERHIETQISRGRLCLIEMDSFYMPDTQGTAYRQEHGKTTVAINRLDFAGKRVEYFHNGGFFTLEGEDFDGLFQLHLADEDPLFLPYTEFAKFPETPVDEAQTRAVSRQLLTALISPAGRAQTRSVPSHRCFRSRSRRLPSGRSASSTNTPSTRCASSAPISSCWPII